MDEIMIQESVLYNLKLAKKIGVNCAIVFGVLYKVSKMFENKEFYYQKENIENDTSLGEQAIRVSLKKLKDTELISINKKGIPCKNWYKINKKKLEELIK